MNAIAQTQGQAPAVNNDAFISLIERFATDPNVDVEKLERLMAMQERAMDRNAKTAFAAALAVMQPGLPVIDERGRITVPAKGDKEGHSTPYAKWEDINDAIRPLLAEHGFALSFRIGQAEDGKITVTGVLSHREGHSEETTITLMHDSTGSKNAVQAVGSSTSYGKRYTAMALLNITTRGEDDDDQLAGETAAVTSAKAAIDECKTLAALQSWHEKNSDVVKTLGGAQTKAVADHYQARFRELREAAK